MNRFIAALAGLVPARSASSASTPALARRDSAGRDPATLEKLAGARRRIKCVGFVDVPAIDHFDVPANVCVGALIGGSTIHSVEGFASTYYGRIQGSTHWEPDLQVFAEKDVTDPVRASVEETVFSGFPGEEVYYRGNVESNIPARRIAIWEVVEPGIRSGEILKMMQGVDDVAFETSIAHFAALLDKGEDGPFPLAKGRAAFCFRYQARESNAQVWTPVASLDKRQRLVVSAAFGVSGMIDTSKPWKLGDRFCAC